MEVINNISKLLGDDLKEVIQSDSHLSIAAACFSIYAFDELRKELEGIKELRFIFTSLSFTTEKVDRELVKAYVGTKSVQKYMFLDGKVEEEFAKEMDIPDNEVYIYAKLPRGFQIPTPMGNYAPDWAIVFRQDKVKHIFFVAETKGTLDSEELRGIEDGKISCAKKLFSSIRTREIHYEHVTTYQDLMNVVRR